MDLYDLLENNKITNEEMDSFSENLSSNPKLKSLCKNLSNKVDEKKAFAIAKIFCDTIIGISLENYAPDLIEEREKILKKDKVFLENANKFKEQFKILKSIEEDMILYIFEKKNECDA